MCCRQQDEHALLIPKIAIRKIELEHAFAKSVSGKTAMQEPRLCAASTHSGELELDLRWLDQLETVLFSR
jgi:hypothetical protein